MADKSFTVDTRWFKIPGLDCDRYDNLYEVAKKNGFDGSMEDWQRYICAAASDPEVIRQAVDKDVKEYMEENPPGITPAENIKELTIELTD